MYASIQTRYDALRNKALSNTYTKAAIERIDGYKQRVLTVKEEALSTVQQRREAAVAFVAQYQELLREIVDDKREMVSQKVQLAGALTSDYVEARRAQVAKTVQVVKERTEKAKSTVASAVEQRKERLTTSASVVVDVAVAFTVTVVAASISVLLRLERLTREAAPPRALASVDAGVAQAKPYAVKAVEGAQYVDRRLGGYGTVLVSRVSEGVSVKLQQSGAPMTEAAAPGQ